MDLMLLGNNIELVHVGVGTEGGIEEQGRKREREKERGNWK